ncbi:MAG: restriction endonuclease subunit S [Spartobacteria bacterium]|nr:restriction endonuclease subunit S [Spartobacteria bacterium]
MPLTPDLRRKVDQIRDYLYGAGYPNPMDNAEQLSFLFFFYLIEGIDEENRDMAQIRKQEYASFFTGEWTLKRPVKGQPETIPAERMRWSQWARAMSGDGLVNFLRDEVFPFYAELAQGTGHNFMDAARLNINDPTVLSQVIKLVDELRLGHADSDTKGDLFEHVLKQIGKAGELGQFRTARHIIRAMVRMIDPKLGETIYDPAAGTAGFLVAAYNHILLQNTSPANVREVDIDGKPQHRGNGDRLSEKDFAVLGAKTFYGNDVDPSMVRLASMNLFLRGLPNVKIMRRNVMTKTLENDEKAELGLPLKGYDVILANPPFSGRVDKDRIVDDVKVGNTSATELLFLKYMIESLKAGGRCGVIVPEGVLFGSTGAHKEIRRQLLDNNTLIAVLSLPGGAFNPYSGVKTSVLFFAKGGRTENVMFLHADNDGYKMDANHDTPIEADDLPVLIEAYAARDQRLKDWQARDPSKPWTEKYWFETADKIRAADYNLSAGCYRPASAEEANHQDPRELLAEIQALELEITAELEQLAASLREAA